MHSLCVCVRVHACTHVRHTYIYKPPFNHDGLMRNTLILKTAQSQYDLLSALLLLQTLGIIVSYRAAACIGTSYLLWLNKFHCVNSKYSTF